MDVLYERCCGIDVHKKMVVACLITPDATGTPTKQTRTYGTMTAGRRRLHACGDGVDRRVLEAAVRRVTHTHLAAARS